MNDEELTEIVLLGIREAKKIAEEGGEKAKEFLSEVQNFYEFPEDQRLCFWAIKEDYFGQRIEDLAEAEKQRREDYVTDLKCNLEAYIKRADSGFKKMTRFTGTITIATGISTFWFPDMVLLAGFFGVSTMGVYAAKKFAKKKANKLREELDEFSKELRKGTGITFEQFKNVMYKNKAEIENCLTSEYLEM